VARGSSQPIKRDSDGNHVANKILLSLPPKEFEAVSPKLELVRLKSHQVIHEAGETLKSGYFCNSGIFSVLSVMPEGKTVEVSLIGREGLAGVPLVAGFRTSYTRTVAQTEATGFRIDADRLRALLPGCPVLERQLNRYAQLLTVQVTQIATCNRLHEVNERLSRWLLMSQDRVGSSALPLTQEFLAQMLGTRRSSVTVAAGALQKAGLIRYARGSVTVLDRRRLEEFACACYDLLRRQTRLWEGQDG
jgi:CRP-like cAMP-binding protein